jgi:methyl-accepting chemotaxis protein
MNLTVAKRIIGGFGVITALLLFIGIVSYVSLNRISDSTSQVNTVSIPALENSAILQSEFVKMSKISLQAFYANSPKEVEALRQQFEFERQQYDDAAQKLQNVVSEEPELAGLLDNINRSYQGFLTSNTKLFSELKTARTHHETITSQLSDLEGNSDDSASLILDFSDLRDVSSRFPKSTAAAAELETSLNTLVSTVVDLTRTDSQVTADTLTNEVKSRLDSIKTLLGTMQTETKGNIDLVADLAEKVTAVDELLTGTDGLLALKHKKLAALAAASKLLVANEQQTEEGLKGLNNLLSKSRDVAGDIQAAAASGVSTAIGTIAMVVLGSIVLAVFIGRITVNSITHPLAKVNEILGVVASGDLTRRLDDSASDEFGELAKNCNKVISSLRDLIQGIIARSTQLAAASEETSAITMQTTQAIRDQKSQVTQAATATTEMSSTAQGVLHSANDALSAIKHADAEAERVKGISENNKQTILQLSHEVEQASKVINKLHQDSASIGSILDVIRSIAEQTNLLALNAAIEAARAGEQGRGFAVVADEVRSLASKTQSSTQEIQAMIQVLQTGAHAAVEAMNKGRRQAENSVSQTEVATHALDSITNAVHQAYDRSEQISHAAKEQNQVSNEISHLLESIVNIAEETASGAEQTSDSSHEVARLAEELRQSVQEFRV